MTLKFTRRSLAGLTSVVTAGFFVSPASASALLTVSNSVDPTASTLDMAPPVDAAGLLFAAPPLSLYSMSTAMEAPWFLWCQPGVTPRPCRG